MQKKRDCVYDNAFGVFVNLWVKRTRSSAVLLFPRFIALCNSFVSIKVEASRITYHFKNVLRITDCNNKETL